MVELQRLVPRLSRHGRVDSFWRLDGVGERGEASPLREDDYEAWHEVRTAVAMVAAWEPRPAGAPTGEDRATFVTRCSMRERERQLGTADVRDFAMGVSPAR